LMDGSSEEKGTELVKLTTLDECVQQFSWTRMDFIKIDAEVPATAFSLRTAHPVEITSTLCLLLRAYVDYNILCPPPPPPPPPPSHLLLSSCSSSNSSSCLGGGECVNVRRAPNFK